MDKDNASNKLEAEYKENLKLIRPYVLSLTDRKALISCRIWIEKLDSQNVDNNMKRIRNNYMTELRKQLQQGNLEVPFTNEPPIEPLEDIYVQNLESDSWSDISEYTARTIDTETQAEEIQMDARGDIKTPFDESFVEDLKQKNALLKTALDKILKETVEARLQEGKKIANILKEKDSEWSKKLNDLRITIIETYEEKIEKINKNKDLEWQKKLNEEVQKIRKEYEDIIRNISDEKELEYEMKAHEIKLTMMEENEGKIKEVKGQKEEELMGKLEYIKISLRNEYETKLKSCKEELRQVRENREKEIRNLQDSYEEQYQKLKEDYEKCTYIQQSNNEKELMKKISFLQNYVLKLEKLLKKYQLKYVEKTECLRRNLAMKENAMQIHLMAQNAQMITQCRNENIAEIESMVDNLEEKYKNLLEEQMKQIKECKYFAKNANDVT